jgi:cyclohexa-1,5-dienecarbonyl-CoA hydratase
MTKNGARIIFEVRDGVARVTLNRPPLNIFDIATITELQAALARVAQEDGAKVLVIDHQGKAFSAGVAIEDHTPGKVPEMITKFHGIFHLLQSIAVPSVALVDGMALGGGCELAVFCDMVIASERATFGQPEIKVGVFPPVAAVLFPHLLGRNRALELILTGDTISAAEARAMGLINRVLPVEGFRDKAGELIARLTSLSGPVLKLAKRAVDENLYRSVSDGIAAVEKLYLGELMQTRDAHEGLNAFLEKRKPVWKNQ